MDGIVLLKEDHKTVEKLFKRFEATDEGALEEKQEIVDRIVDELTTHTFIEEEIFYPAARAADPDTAEHVLESIEEHHVAVWICAELGMLEPADERFDAKVRVLIESVRHHVKEEERDWFPQVRKAMGRNRLKELGEQMAAAKDRAPDAPLDVPSAE
ncbi:hemerythrin domain-containing protein [Streptomyces sp. NPDC003042]